MGESESPDGKHDFAHALLARCRLRRRGEVACWSVALLRYLSPRNSGVCGSRGSETTGIGGWRVVLRQDMGLIRQNL